MIHLAAYYDFSGEPSPLYDEITVRGTGRLLHELRAISRRAVRVLQHDAGACALRSRASKSTKTGRWSPKWDYPRVEGQDRGTDSPRARRHPLRPAAHRRRLRRPCHSIPLANQMQRISSAGSPATCTPATRCAGQAFLHLDDLVDALERMVERRGRLPARADAAAGRAGDAQLRRAAAPRSAGLSTARNGRRGKSPRSLAKTGGLAPGQAAPGRGAVHQAVDDRPGRRPLRPGHHAHGTLLGWRAEAFAARRRCRRWSRH